jgi:hypothetical protein
MTLSSLSGQVLSKQLCHTLHSLLHRVRAAIPLFACATPQLRYKHHAGPKQVFVLNCGSSSIKYQLMSLSTKDEIPKVIAKGLVERIGEPSSPIKHEKYDMPLCVRHRIMAED